ncbi:MAG: ATP-binding cassette domain-containing protein [Eubacteriales bacterium]|nr:ATP-binding cassette domain-containing protein [Eubacteriales bacterium]
MQKNDRKDHNEIILELENVCYTYEDGTEALKGVNLKVVRGEKLAIMGANGSGKSTLFLTLNGIHKPNKGMVLYNHIPVDYSRKGLLALRKKIGIVFQDPDNQLFSASVTQEISFGVLNLGLSFEEARERVEKIIEELNITSFRDKPTHFLSGGQKKRVSIADILVMNPEMILFDEPAAALDPKHARMIDEIIDQLSEKGITVILSTHDVNRAFLWADRIVLMDEGSIVSEGTPDEIFTDEAALAQTNLEKPTVLKIFESLCKSGVLDRTLPVPHTANELEQYIREGTV